MSEHERSDWLATLGWSMVALVLFGFGMLFGEEVFALFSLVAVGLAAASGVKAFRSRVQSSEPTSLLEEQVADLRTRLEAAESEIQRLREEADFDRKLLGSHKDPGGS